MEDSAETSWFSDQMGMEDPFVSDPYDIRDFLDEELSAAFGGDELLFQNSLLSQQCNSSSSFSSTIMIPRNNSTTSLSADSNTENQNQAYYNNVVPSPLVLSFGAAGNNDVINNDASVSDTMANSRGDDQDAAIRNASTVPTKKKTGGRTRPPSQTYDHIIAERKRREQLSQQFVALSSIVPGLKKMDKTTVLGDTITYMKQLQEREKALEERATMQMMESMVLVKKSQVVDYDGVEVDNDGDEESTDDRHEHEQPLPDIEAKVCDERHILLRIMCEKHKGVLVKILSELERCNLGVTSTNVATFGSLALDITIVTEMRENFNLSTNELVGVLGSTIRRRRS